MNRGIDIKTLQTDNGIELRFRGVKEDGGIPFRLAVRIPDTDTPLMKAEKLSGFAHAVMIFAEENWRKS